MRLRTLDKDHYDRLVSGGNPPYLPVLLEACRQDQFSYEYRDGVTSYGAFTYSLVKDLRNRPGSTFRQVMSRTTTTLKDLGYDQDPQLVGPSDVVSKPVPGAPSGESGRRK